MISANKLLALAVLPLLLASCGGTEPAKTPPGIALDPPPSPKVEPRSAPSQPSKPKASLLEVQKKTVAALEDALNKHDAKKLADLYAPEAMTGGPTPDGWKEVKARDAMEKSHAELFAGFPDFKLATVRVVQKGDMVVHEWHASGTHKGDFRGTKASGKSMNLRGASVYLIGEDGWIKNEHNYFDHNTVRVQIGAAQGKVRAAAAPAAPATEWIVAKGDEEKNVAVAAKFFENMSKEKETLALLTDDVTMTSFASPDDQKGKEAVRADMQMWLKAFPDAKSTITRIMGAGDFVVVELAFAGTHKGALGPLKATNKPVTVQAIDVLQLKDGKIAKGWTYMSTLEMMSQLGAAPDKKPDEKKADDKKSEEKKADEKKADDKKPAPPPAPDKKPDAKPAEKK
jgi:steroid delta-isomerase-like uncharacterized protein